MTYRFGVCDDEPGQRENLSQLVQAWANARGHHADISCFPSGEAFLFDYAADKSCEILLLDIEMEKMTGVELARTVRAENKAMQIIFITGYMEYIADGYEVEALHYLLKPVTEEKFFAVLDRAAEKVNRAEQALVLDMPGESVRVPLYEIRYLEVRKNYVTVHAREKFTFKATLGQLEQKLDEGFFRAGRSFIVHLRHVKKITKTDIFLSGDAVIPLPRGMYDAIHRAMIELL